MNLLTTNITKQTKLNEIRFLPLMYDKGDTENVFYMLAVYQLQLSANQVVYLCRDMRPSRQAHNPNLDTRCHHLFYFDIEKYALKIEVSKEKQNNKINQLKCASI